MDADTESYIMLLLADGNLPTGAFVSSSGLESYITHGFFSASTPRRQASSTALANQAMMNFVQDNVHNYARSAIPFVSDAHLALSTTSLSVTSSSSDRVKIEELIEESVMRIVELDALYQSMTLNEVTRRASQAQGVALLTLFSKGFSLPALPPLRTQSAYSSDDPSTPSSNERSSYHAAEHLVNRLKLMVRRGDTYGHLPVCWGVLTSLLGLSLGRCILFFLAVN